ncbi:unnamed protein product [Callosobruchus maculatus]|uniref:Large ribosomal subunit protein bL9m n=1 Tax=Callosobruchus maculatus TaxID=64391 RepID=A0A653BEQ7_CALMS|nr:unnamed protein product [Callosobruchus maculatus]
MWKSVLTAISRAPLLQTTDHLNQQLRTTFILRRKTPPQLHKQGKRPKTLRSRHYIYELVKDTNCEKKPNIDVILTSYVEGLGNAGEKVSVRPSFAYNKLLLPGLAVYASPENIDKFKNLADDSEKVRYSSKTAFYTVQTMSQILLSVVMNKENPWTLKPWHIRVSFRKCGYIVPEDAITMPEKPISGPDMELEGKEFAVTVTINNQEKVNVRCRLHHWSTNVTERIPHIHNFWEMQSEPVIPEQASLLEEMPKKRSLNKKAQASV